MIEKYRRNIIAFYESTVRKLYRNIRRKHSFILNQTIIPVKKGKIRYTLVFIETTEGKIRLNLGRHFGNPIDNDKVNAAWEQAY